MEKENHLKSIDEFSCIPVQIMQMKKESTLGRATGFYVDIKNRLFLVTNWHVVTASNPLTGKLQNGYSSKPSQLKVYNHSEMFFGKWEEMILPLYDDKGNKLWIEHPRGEEVDVVAIEVSQLKTNFRCTPVNKSVVYEEMVPRPGMPVFVVGFPLGMTNPPSFPIWKTGHIATDPDLDYQNKPRFLIDATTRGGMSGSPVFLRLSSGFEIGNGAIKLSGLPTNKFLGIYSGRVNSDIELGFIWKPQAISEVLRNIHVELWTT